MLEDTGEWKKNGNKLFRGWRLPGLLYTDDKILCSESEEDLKVMVGHF